MNEAQAEFIQYAAAAIEAIIAGLPGPCEVVDDDIWGEVCRVCEIGGAAQTIEAHLRSYLEEHPEIYA